MPIWAIPYVNGREVGWCLTDNRTFKVAFTECRNSDELVVYDGQLADFDAASNVPSEAALPDPLKKAAPPSWRSVVQFDGRSSRGRLETIY